MGTKDLKELLADINDVPQLKVLKIPSFDKHRLPILGDQEQLDKILAHMWTDIERDKGIWTRSDWVDTLVCHLLKKERWDQNEVFTFGARSLASFLNISIEETIHKEEKCDLFFISVGEPTVLLTVFKSKVSSKDKAQQYNRLLSRALSKAIKTYLDVPFSFVNGALDETDIFGKDFDKIIDQLIQRSSILLNPLSLQMTTTKWKSVVNAFIMSMAVTKPVIVDGENVFTTDRYLLALSPNIFLQIMDVLLEKKMTLRCANKFHGNFIRIELAKRLGRSVETLLQCDSRVVCNELRKLDVCFNVEHVDCKREDKDLKKATSEKVILLFADKPQTGVERNTVISCIKDGRGNASEDVMESFEDLSNMNRNDDGDDSYDGGTSGYESNDSRDEQSPQTSRKSAGRRMKYVYKRGGKKSKAVDEGDEHESASARRFDEDKPIQSPLKCNSSNTVESFNCSMKQASEKLEDELRLQSIRDRSPTIATAPKRPEKIISNMDYTGTGPANLNNPQIYLPEDFKSMPKEDATICASRDGSETDLCVFCSMKKCTNIAELMTAMQEVFPTATAHFSLIIEWKSKFLRWKLFIDRITESKTEFMLKNVMMQRFPSVPLPLTKTGDLVLSCTCRDFAETA